MLWSSLRALVENIRAGLNKSVNEVFRAGSVDSLFHVDNAIDSITLRYPEGALSDDGDGSTKGEEVVDPPAKPEAIEL